MNKIVKLTLGVLATAAVVACNQQGETKATNPATPAPTSSTEVKQEKIVYVNSDSLSEQYQYFKDIRAKLEAKVKKAQTDLQSKSQAYQREVADYQQKAGSMSATDRQATEERLVRRQQELQRLDQNASQSIAQDENTEFNKVYTSITDYLKKHAEENGYKFVLTYSKTNPAVLYADPNADITKSVIGELNKEYKATQAAEKK